MKLGFIGLGRMGREMVLHFLERGVDVVVYNRSREKTDSLVKEYTVYSIQYTGHLTASYSIKEFVSKLEKPRIIWLMVEHGKPVDEMIEQLVGNYPKVSIEIHLRGELDRTPLVKLTAGDIIIDGGNSFYKDSIRRYNFLKKKGIHFLDVGTSGGLSGARNGVCVMVGGDKEIFERLKPLFENLATKNGVAYFGSSGAGHFVKMVHNGVEYGMLQAIGEGFEILSKGMPVTKPFARRRLAKPIDLRLVAENWSHGSVVRGWLMELLERALKADPKLKGIKGVIGGGSTGEWTVKTAKELKVEVPVIKKSLEARKKSFAKPTFSGKVVAALRYQFGGHAIKKK